MQAPAEQRLLHFQLHLPISRTRGHGSRISCVTPVGSQHEAVWEAFPSRSEPIGPSRSEPIKTPIWLTVPAAALIPIFLHVVDAPPAPAAPAQSNSVKRMLRVMPRLRSRCQQPAMPEARRPRADALAAALPYGRGVLIHCFGRAKQWMKGFANTLRFSPAARNPPLFDLTRQTRKA